MDKMRLAQGLVFIFASLLVVVVGLRGINPDAIPLYLVYSALGVEGLMLIIIGVLYIWGQNNNGDGKVADLKSKLDESKKILDTVVDKLNSPATSSSHGVMDEIGKLRAELGYMHGILEYWQR
ncbi:MAG: hypothetical protein C4326_12070 [Ignavibacteria bacterium]